MNIGIIFTVVVFLAVCWWWFIGRNRSKYPPLEIADDDPLMLEALDKAKATISKFKELLSGEYEEAQVKVPFTTSEGLIEHLWAEVLGVNKKTLRVRYYTLQLHIVGR